MRKLAELQTGGTRRAPDYDMIIALVATTKRVPRRMFTNGSRCRDTTARARQLAMYLAHVVLGRSLAEVGDAFRRDRTTVSYACARIEDMRDDPLFDAEVSRLEQVIEAQEQLV